MAIEKIIITSDLLRTGDSSDRSSFIKNTEWLFRLLNKQISHAAQIPLKVVEWGGNYNFKSETIYSSYSLKPSIDSWAKIFDEIPNDESLEYINKFFNKSTVVAFELSPFFKLAFQKLQISYINLQWHPVRFMDDIFFAFQTNNPQIFDCLKKYQMPVSAFYSAAELIRAENLRKSNNLDFEENLFVGQTEVDRSLIFNKKIAKLHDFTKELVEYKKLYFRPHPFSVGQSNLLENFATSNLNSCNIYDVLCLPDLKSVVGLSSGVLLEAKYFEKKSHRLIKENAEFYSESSLSEFSSNCFVPVYHEFLSVDFWANILQPISENTFKDNFSVPFKPNRLRKANCSNWGFNNPDVKNIIENYE